MRARDAEISDDLHFDLAQTGLQLVCLAHRAKAQGSLSTEGAEQLTVVGAERPAPLGSALQHSELFAALRQGESSGGGTQLVGSHAGRGDHRNGACGGRTRPPQSQRPPGGGDQQLENLGSAGMFGCRSERVDQSRVAADLVEEPTVGGALQPVADRQHEGGDRQQRRGGWRSWHEVGGRGIGSEPRQPSRRAENRHEPDTDRNLAHRDGRIAQRRLDDRRRSSDDHRRPGHRPRQRGEEPVARLEQPEQAHELEHGNDPGAGDE